MVAFEDGGEMAVFQQPLRFSRGIGMGMVPLDSLEPGMILASDVHDRTGRLLLGSGAELSQKHLVIFRSWGVEEADITGVDTGDGISPLPEDVTPEQVAAAEEKLKPLFNLAGPDHPVLRELLRLAALKKVYS